jgi:hypothetical protein
MIPNHPYSYPPAHTMVTMHVTGEGERLGYHDGQSIWFTECGQVELRVMGWSALW